MKKALVSIVIGLLLGSAGFVAGVLYGSNRESGTINVSANLVLTGSLPTTYTVGQSVVTSEFIKNTLSTGLNVYLTLDLSSPSMSSSNATITMAGTLTTPVCTATDCSYQSASFTVNVGATVQADVGILFNSGGQYAYVIQAWGS